jgi:hypothetical protein
MADEDVDLKNKMVYEGLLIIKTVDFLERQVKQSMKEIDKAREEFDTKAEDIAEKNLISLLKKLEEEDQGIIQFLRKYEKLIEQESKETCEKNELMLSMGKTANTSMEPSPVLPKVKKQPEITKKS